LKERAGEGETFMKEKSGAERLPSHVTAEVEELFEMAKAILGAIRFEWAYDGQTAWLLQLHRGATQSAGNVIFPGDARQWKAFNPAAGLEVLREMIASSGPGDGLMVTGEIGLTSHLADLIRRAGIPAQIAAQ
jgi:hypothetical protein